MKEIWIVEDDMSISNLLKMGLTEEGYFCKCHYNGKTVADMLEDEHVPDMILLDIMLPEINGYDLLEYIRPMRIPVIFITAKGTTQEKIYGLQMGADDYIVKPFQVGEVIARVEAVLRRTVGDERYIQIDDVTIDTASRRVSKGGKDILLTIKEFELLVMLCKNKNIALYREQLYERVWQEPFTGETRTLDSHVQRLRRKLDWNDKIVTVFRIGYRLEE